VAFARATEAISAAVGMQRARIGLYTGEPQLSAEGYIGLDVHRAARNMSAGHGGQVLLSQTTRDLVEHDLPGGVSLRDLGGNPATTLMTTTCSIVCKKQLAKRANVCKIEEERLFL